MSSCTLVSKPRKITASIRAEDKEMTPHTIQSKEGQCGAVLHSCNENRNMALNVYGWLTKWCLTCLWGVCMCTVNMTHSRCQRGDSQSAEHVSLVADRPQRNHVHGALSCTRQDGHFTQWYGRDFLPGSCGGQFTLPVQEDKHTMLTEELIVKSAAKDAAGVRGVAKEPCSSNVC